MNPGTVYRKFSCGCLTTENPAIVFIKVNGKGKKLTICPHCQAQAALYIQHIRACADCGKVDTSHRMLAGKYCRECSRHHRAEKRALKERPGQPVYYQAGKRIKKPAKLVTEPMCRHRLECLPMGLNDLLHCGGCQKFEREDLELIYDRRDHDPFEMALGEAV